MGRPQETQGREIRPGEGAVLTIGTIQGGTAYNVIADQVEMRGTLRAFSQELRQVLLGRIPEVAGGYLRRPPGHLRVRCATGVSSGG